MSSRGAALYIADILDAIEKVQRYTHGLSFQEFLKDGKTLDAVIRNLSVTGEAATNIPGEIAAANQQIPWSEIVVMRNKVIHEYFGVDLSIVWALIKDELPPLRPEIKRLLTNLEKEEYLD